MAEAEVQTSEHLNQPVLVVDLANPNFYRTIEDPELSGSFNYSPESASRQYFHLKGDYLD